MDLRSHLASRGVADDLIDRAGAQAPNPTGAWVITRDGTVGVLVASPTGITLAVTGHDEVVAIDWADLTALSTPAPFAAEITHRSGQQTRVGFRSPIETKAFLLCAAHRGDREAIEAASAPGSSGRRDGNGAAEGPVVSGTGSSERIRANRARSRRMIDALAEQKKYRMPLQGERFAVFSLWGTEDWEDMASLAFRAMILESIVDLDQRVEGMASSLERIEGHLRSIAEAVAPGGVKE